MRQKDCNSNRFTHRHLRPRAAFNWPQFGGIDGELKRQEKTYAQDFQRIQRLPPYVFEQVNKLKAQARAQGKDIIDFGMGNPDLPTPDHIVEKLVETVRNPRTHRYSASKGIPGLRKAQARYYERRFG